MDEKFDRELIRMLISEHRLTLVEIAARIGCHPRTVARVKATMPDEPRKPATRRYSSEILARAKEMLEDRAGYRQTALTLGLYERHLRRNLPGYALTREESLERAQMGQTFNNLSNSI